MDEYFKTTDFNNLPTSKSQNNALAKNIQFVNGSDFHTNIYDINHVQHKLVKFFQLGMFSQNDKKAIRMYILQGTAPVGGSCLYEYKVTKIKDYSLNNENYSKFEKELIEKNAINSKSDIKIMFKYYPVYNFDFTSPPSGNDINQCTSELLN